MNLPIPVVGVDPGPDYATDLNSCLTIIDTHNHSSGSGVQITPSGLNINIDLPISNNNITGAKSVRFQPQSVALGGSSDKGCLYEVVSDLYYNDASGNQIRITQSGAVAGTPGSISNLVAPASASYVSGSLTFVWQSDVNTAANLDAGSIIVRNLTASSNGITISPPVSLASDYTITLPALPASQKFMTLDASGNISAPWSVDGTTLEISSNVIQIKDLGVTTAKINDAAVTTAKIADGAVTPAKRSALGQQISSSCANFSSANTSQTDVTNLSVTITTTGRPVFIGLISDGSVNNSQIGTVRSDGGQNISSNFFIVRGGSNIAFYNISQELSATLSNVHSAYVPASAISTIDPVAAGTYTYKIQVTSLNTSVSTNVNYSKLIAYEL